MMQVHPELSGKDIDFLFETIDQDHNGSISFLEFTAATIDPRFVDIQEMNQVRSSPHNSNLKCTWSKFTLLLMILTGFPSAR